MKRLHLLLLLTALQPGCTVSDLRIVAAQPQASAGTGLASEPLDVLQARARQAYAAEQFEESAKAYKTYLERAPGDAQAWQPSSAASCRVISPWAKRAPTVCTLPASSPSLGGRVTPPGTSTLGKSRLPAKAIIMAGSPLSQVATPMIP